MYNAISNEYLPTCIKNTGYNMLQQYYRTDPLLTLSYYIYIQIDVDDDDDDGYFMLRIAYSIWHQHSLGKFMQNGKSW